MAELTNLVLLRKSQCLGPVPRFVGTGEPPSFHNLFSTVQVSEEASTSPSPPVHKTPLLDGEM